MTDHEFAVGVDRAWRGQYRNLTEAQQAHSLMEHAGSRPDALRWQAEVVASIATIRLGTTFERAAQQLPRLGALLAQAGDVRWAAIARYGEALALGRSNRVVEALSAAQEALALVRGLDPTPQFETLVFSNGCGSWHKQLGHWDEALYDLLRASEACKATDEIGLAASIESNIGTVYYCSGNTEDGLESFERAWVLAQAGQATHVLALIAANTAQCLWRLGRNQEALERCAPLLSDVGALAYRSSQIWAVASLSAAALGRPEALDWARHALDMAARAPYVEDVALAHTAHGHALMATDQLQDAWLAFTRARDTVGADGERVYRLLALEGCARCARALGDTDGLAQAQDALLPLRDQLAGMAARTRVAGLRIRNQLAELEAERDRARRAQAQAEQALAALRSTQERLERVNGDLSLANARLHELHASRTRMLAAACHDLRQPAHALGMLAEVAAAKVPAEGRTAIEAIRRSSASLSDLLDALFDLSRLESDRYEPNVAPISLAELFDDMRSQFAVAALSKGLRLSVDEVAGAVRSDSHLLRRMLMNLLSNAIKYTASGAVQLQAMRDGGEWVLSVTDTGPGIPAEQQEAAFAEYVRLEQAGGTDGLGIGLAIVRRSAALLGHPLVLNSTVGQGSRFTLRLPADNGVAAVDDPAAEGDSAGQVIGLVDDDDQIRQAMRELLTLRGYVAHAAPTLEALHQQLTDAGTPRPDLVLSDFHLGSGDSLDTLANLLAHDGPWARVPAVLITGDLSAELPVRCQALGITMAYKPLPARKLTQLIARLLSRPDESAGRRLSQRA